MSKKTYYIILIGIIVLFSSLFMIDTYGILTFSIGMGVFSIINFILLMCMYYTSYKLCKASDEKREYNDDYKMEVIVIALVAMIGSCLLNTFLINDMAEILLYSDADVTWIIVDVLLLCVEMVIILVVSINNVFLWYPVTFFSSLYVTLFGNATSGLDNVGLYLVLLFVLLLVGIIEYAITLWLNLKRLKIVNESNHT